MGALSRDEMIAGPLSAPTDRNPGSVGDMMDIVLSMRESHQASHQALSRVAQGKGVAINTLKNYTRWPIALMRDCGWTIKIRLPFPQGGRSFEAHQLTHLGQKLAHRLTESTDIRVDQVDDLPFDAKAAFCKHAHYSLLARADFDLKPVRDTLEQIKPALKKAHDLLGIDHDRHVLFSPSTVTLST